MADIESTTTPRALGTQKARQLKVSSYYPESSARKVNGVIPPVSYVRLHGRWLMDAGFAIGQRIRVEVQEGRLTIELAE